MLFLELCYIYMYVVQYSLLPKISYTVFNLTDILLKQSGTKPKQVIKKITETSYFSFSLHQSKSVKFLLIYLKYAGFYIIKMLMGDAAR